MKKLIAAVMCSVFTFSAFASNYVEDIHHSEAKEEIVSMLENAENEESEFKSLGVNENSCSPEIHKRLNQLKRRTAFAPFIGFGEVYAGAAVGAYIGALIGLAIDSTGWTGLIYALSGAIIGAEVLLVVYGAQQTLVISRLVHVHQLEKAVLEAEGKKEGTRYLDKLVKKFLFRYPSARSKVTREVLAQFLRESNATGSLCNGSMVKRLRSGANLKKRIPLRRELFASFNESLFN